jgi:hypothetical protein
MKKSWLVAIAETAIISTVFLRVESKDPGLRFNARGNGKEDSISHYDICQRQA